MPVLAHVGRPGTAATIRLARRALEVGASSVAAVIPYYYQLDSTQVVAHYRALLDALAGTPVFAYTIPARTGNQLEPDALATLAAHGLAGLKDSTKSWERGQEYLAAVRGGSCRVMTGTPAFLLDALDAGAAGCVFAVANLRPDLPVGLKRAWAEGRSDDARALQAALTWAQEQVTRRPGLADLKSAVAARLQERGVAFSPALRAPLGPLPDRAPAARSA